MRLQSQWCKHSRFGWFNSQLDATVCRVGRTCPESACAAWTSQLAHTPKSKRGADGTTQQECRITFWDSSQKCRHGLNIIAKTVKLTLKNIPHTKKSACIFQKYQVEEGIGKTKKLFLMEEDEGNRRLNALGDHGQNSSLWEPLVEILGNQMRSVCCSYVS